jgi:NTP pyrophosphatase (non-canonical NTP hydrolase)
MDHLTFTAVRDTNVARCLKWHPLGIGSWSPSDWLVAAMGELGELASEVKTYNCERDGLPGNKEQLTPKQRKQRMANEAADVVTYLDLFCAERGIDLGAAVVRKFNEVSQRVGLPDRLVVEPSRELVLLRAVAAAGERMRATAIVDDDFPAAMHRFDCALRAYADLQKARP